MKTIKSSAEISTLFSTGKRIHTAELTLIVSRNQEQHGQQGRAAFVAGKKLGNAVWRNKAKRRMRHICMQLGGPFKGYDVVFLAKRSVNNVPYERLLQSLNTALIKNGLKKDV